MTVDGVTYLQSMAIARYAGRLGGFYPTDPLAAFKVDEIMESMCEVFETIVDIVIYTPDADQKAKKIVTLKARLEVVFAFIESKIQSKFLFGDEMTLADIHLFDFFAHGVLVACPEYTLESFPKITATIETVKAMPKIAAYLAARP
ncbi:hypothetical protein Poli38472_010146 [Pythium oligandrum]|uniref:GST C-terminal domain-containing protein n=1 Tax=Pythium oligandrum TaxID=41045 RepID=A0A8K1C9V4_PYTOL|nr:hypothetical protein Poli38472_010146 [Pythium oligandrum]|eukprot:TMW58587.1 hypothetical protein Poli38472_010146 [Pythium oligandrum]